MHYQYHSQQTMGYSMFCSSSKTCAHPSTRLFFFLSPISCTGTIRYPITNTNDNMHLSHQSYSKRQSQIIWSSSFFLVCRQTCTGNPWTRTDVWPTAASHFRIRAVSQRYLPSTGNSSNHSFHSIFLCLSLFFINYISSKESTLIILSLYRKRDRCSQGFIIQKIKKM